MLCIVRPVSPLWKTMSDCTCSPKSCMKPSAPRSSASLMRPCHHVRASGFEKSIIAASAWKFEKNRYGCPLGVLAT